MKLYTHPGSCSSASHISLLEAGLDFDTVKVDLFGDRKLPDGRHYHDVNPKGYVPALELDSGDILTENVAVLQYIADQNPASGLAPANGTLDRFRLQEWLGFVNSEMHAWVGPLFQPNTPEETKQTIHQKFAGRLQYVNEQLAGKDYIMGGQFSVADAYLYIVLSWMPHINVDLSPYANIIAYQARVAERESVQTATAA